MTDHNAIRKVLNYRSFAFIYLILFFWISGCKNSTPEAEGKQIDEVLKYKDLDPITDSYIDTLNALRKHIGKKDISRLVKLYQIKQLYTRANLKKVDQANLYADSAIALFNDPDLIAENKTAYLEALISKGDALYLSNKYTQAVLYYLEARSFRKKNLDSCHNRILSVRLGNVYYVQGKFTKSASCYKEGYELEKTCNSNTNPLKKFYEIQGLLNNIGFCYERANLLDSAQYFYQKDLEHIEASRTNPKISIKALNDAATIVLDNLGSVYLKKGNLVKAEELLQRSIATKYSGDTSVNIPPLIKLANLYTQKHNYKAAEKAFSQANTLLIISPNADLEAKWNKIRSQFYQQQGQFKLAYNAQQQYLLLRDSIERDHAKLASIDVEKDFTNLEQNYNLQTLEKKDATKSIYLIFIAFLLLMVIIIAFLMFRNIKLARKSSQIIERHNQTLQETLLKLEDANQNYVRVMKVMAHDLRNPLSGIAGISSFLIEDHQPVDEKASLEIIRASADNALGLINELLNSILPAHGAESITFKKERFNIKLLLQQCISLLSFKADEKHQNIVLETHEDFYVHADADKLWRVFNNIIVNAIKFSHERSTIAIDIKDGADQLVIKISDTGIGIPKDFEERVFDMFTETKRSGTAGEKPYGLGLSISKQIVEGHNGKIWFEANPVGGTIFFIQLPK
ncbi:tetratricopeptide repeat-containing sensor histidine kinase [Pedobacter sp. Hv1]|uniref:tetratricopeptide repeat-containing sensor histidine kinase n=1 Tax=Pedobacter sp. Hv1 TaxID=1740090 RepID=UPI0006D8946C|nr:tetratricopeptide repeat-containing sensor histidine kinase [Pedobacter sp. Hv1]KQC01885.1 hypothetical protein AQF98_05845 [Pedobacter sp. Hv1]